MNEQVRTIAIEMIRTHGPAITDNSQRAVALLRDLCGERQGLPEFHVLSLALRAGIAKDLAARDPQVPPGVLLTRLTQRLERDHGLRAEMAEWAVETWALALDVPITVAKAAAVTPDARPPAHTPPPPAGPSYAPPPSYRPPSPPAYQPPPAHQPQPARQPPPTVVRPARPPASDGSRRIARFMLSLHTGLAALFILMSGGVLLWLGVVVAFLAISNLFGWRWARRASILWLLLVLGLLGGVLLLLLVGPGRSLAGGGFWILAVYSAGGLLLLFWRERT